MVSGTGKTLTGMFITEKLNVKNMLVLVPSLLLQKQTLKVWRANATTPFKSLPVGSNTTANDDSGRDLSVSELGYPTTTDAGEIAEFLRGDGVKVVFSTYQSSAEIAKAQAMDNVPAFDLVISDEAHRTAGSLSSYFATVLHDEKIKAVRRLFMTATPRNFTTPVLKKAIELGDERASMNDEKRYGEVFYELPYAKALKLKLVTDYRIAIIAVTEDDYREWATKGKFVKLDGAVETNARKVAGQITVLKAMREFDLHRIITFHNRVERARDFAETLPEALSWLSEDERPSGQLWAKYIDGEMSVDDRGLLLDQLADPAEGQRKVLANAKVLTEGVDVTALDGIAVLDPKRSAIEIYQAQGRAIRLDPGKPNPADEISTTIIPVFVPAGDDVDTEAILKSSAFEPVWDQLLRMRDYDERFAEWVNGFRLELGLQHKSQPPTLPKQLVTNIHEALGEDFARAFLLKLVKLTTASFEEFLGRMQRYVAEHGDALVPVNFKDDGYPLGVRVNTMRTQYATGELNSKRVERLNAIGFVWSVLDAAFEEGLRHWQDFYAQKGTISMPKGYKTDGGFALERWQSAQRESYAKNELAPDRVERLTELGFVFNPDKSRWDEIFRLTQELAEAKATVLAIKGNEVVGDHKIGRWIVNQRRLKGKLAADRIELLESLPGWEWNTDDAAFNTGVCMMQKYRTQMGHATPQFTEKFDGFPIGGWVNKQRTRKATLAPERVAALDAIDGWVWNVEEARWKENFALMKAEMEQNGGVMPTANKTVIPESGKPVNIGSWGVTQRKLKRKGELAVDRVKLLGSLPGWEWEPGSGPRPANLEKNTVKAAQVCRSNP
jgi:superfamily II DNA or RNA helicase